MSDLASVANDFRYVLMNISLVGLIMAFVYALVRILSSQLSYAWPRTKWHGRIVALTMTVVTCAIAQKLIRDDDSQDSDLIAPCALVYNTADAESCPLELPSSNSTNDAQFVGYAKTDDAHWFSIAFAPGLHLTNDVLDVFTTDSLTATSLWYRLSRFAVWPNVTGALVAFNTQDIEDFYRKKGRVNPPKAMFFTLYGVDDTDNDGRSDAEEQLEYQTSLSAYDYLPDPPFPQAEASSPRFVLFSLEDDNPISEITGKPIINFDGDSGYFTPNVSGYYLMSCSADDYISYTVGTHTLESLWTTHANPAEKRIWLDAGTTYSTSFKFEDYGGDHWFKYNTQLIEPVTETTNCAPALIVFPTEIAVSKKHPIEIEPTAYVTNKCNHVCSIDVSSPVFSDSPTNHWYKMVEYTLIHDGERRTTIPCYYKYIDDKEPAQACNTCCTEGFDPANGCVEISQKFGRTPYHPSLPAGRVVILESTPTSRLASNACIKYDHPMMREIVRYSGYDAIIKNGLGETIEYKDGMPAGFSSGLTSQFYHDGTNYIERISEDLEVVYAHKKAAYLRTRFGDKISTLELGIYVDRDENGLISSIYSRADGTITYEPLEETNSWRLVWTSPTGAPVKTFTFSGNGYDIVCLEERRNEQFTFNYRWVYSDTLKDWVYTKGIGSNAISKSKEMSYDEDTHSWLIHERTLDANGDTISSDSSVLEMNGTIPTVVSRSSADSSLYSATRDALGRVTSETNDKGLRTFYTRDKFGRVLSERTRYADSLDKETIYRYAFGPRHNVDPRPIEKTVRIGGITVEYETYTYEPHRYTRRRVYRDEVRTSIIEYDKYGREVLSVGEDGIARTTEYSRQDIVGAWTETRTENKTRQVRRMNAQGNATNVVDYVLVDGAWQETSSRSMTYDVAHRVTSTMYSDGRSSATEWICTGAVWERDTEGVVTSNEYNSVKSRVRSTRFGPLGVVETSYSYDAAGRIINETQRADGCPDLVRSINYDARGRISSEVGYDGIALTHTYTDHDLVHTKTYADGGTEITTINPDGTLASITGTAVVPRFYTYGVVEYGATSTTIHYGTPSSPRYDITIRNAFGEVIRRERSGYNGAIIVTNYEYDTNGRLIRETTDGEPEKTYGYNEWGEIDSIVESSGNVSRYTTLNETYNLEDGVVYRDRLETISADGCEEQTTLTREQVSELTLEFEAHQVITDKYGSITETTSSFDPTTSIRRSIVRSDAATNVVSQCFVDGLVTQTVSVSAITNTFRYNAYGWKTATVDGRGNVSTCDYDARGNLIRERDACGNSVSYGYDSMNRLIAITNQLGNVTRYEYDLVGRKTYEGGATYPVRYSYDEFGNRTSMTTHRDESTEVGDTTTWTYDLGSGFVTRKTYADGHGPRYTYSSDGRLASRTWARGVVTSYAYDGWGNLTSTTYSDDTPSVLFAYDAFGRVASASDVSGVSTYTYDEKGDESEIVQSGLIEKALTRHYDTFGRDIGYSLDGSRQITVGYDEASGRIASAEIGGITHTWEYLPGTELKSRLNYGTAGSAEWTYERQRDLLTQVRNSAHGGIISQYDYTNDAAGRRISKNDEVYGYNERSELVSATGNGNYAYTYDDIGNRISSTEPEESFSYTANNLNQYTQISTVNLNLQPQPFVPQYDADGNQTLVKTKTGIWSVTYNGENRPVNWTCGATNIVMKYDRMGRRVEYLETVLDASDSSVVTNKHQRFVYDNYLCVQRLDATSDNAVTDDFVWDPTEPIATRPLYWQTITANGSHQFFYTHDGNKNVSDVVHYTPSTGVAAHYDYAPFGEVRSQAGELSPVNPFRFSSEFADDTLGLDYYNYRHYEPMIGRWYCQDLMFAISVVNPYAFCRNLPIDLVDSKGLLAIFLPNVFPSPSVEDNFGYGDRPLGQEMWFEMNYSGWLSEARRRFTQDISSAIDCTSTELNLKSARISIDPGIAGDNLFGHPEGGNDKAFGDRGQNNWDAVARLGKFSIDYVTPVKVEYDECTGCVRKYTWKTTMYVEDILGMNKKESWLGALLYLVAPERRIKRATWELSGRGFCKCMED